ncbi:MAG: Fur family transcriptional regulator [Candidatus Neomarinimicrobiota bacterium]
MLNKDKLKTALKKEGLRYTSQRQLVFDEVCRNVDHRDADDIFLSLRNRNKHVSRATIYRTIEVLVKNKLLKKLDVGDGRARFERVDAPEHHDHIICVECGKIEEFIDQKIEKFQEKIVRDRGDKMVRHILQLFVVCKECGAN